MARTERGAHHRALAAFVAQHRPALEEHAVGDAEATWVAKAVLEWAEIDERTNGVVER